MRTCRLPFPIHFCLVHLQPWNMSWTVIGNSIESQCGQAPSHTAFRSRSVTGPCFRHPSSLCLPTRSPLLWVCHQGNPWRGCVTGSTVHSSQTIPSGPGIWCTSDLCYLIVYTQWCRSVLLSATSCSYLLVGRAGGNAHLSSYQYTKCERKIRESKQWRAEDLGESVGFVFMKLLVKTAASWNIRREWSKDILKIFVSFSSAALLILH